MNCIVANGGETTRSVPDIAATQYLIDRGAATDERIDADRARAWLGNVTDFCAAQGKELEGVQSLTATPTTTCVSFHRLVMGHRQREGCWKTNTKGVGRNDWMLTRQRPVYHHLGTIRHRRHTPMDRIYRTHTLYIVHRSGYCIRLPLWPDSDRWTGIPHEHTDNDEWTTELVCDFRRGCQPECI